MNIFKRDFDKTKCIYFLIKDEEFFYKYNEIWEKFNNNIQKSNSERMYNKKN